MKTSRTTDGRYSSKPFYPPGSTLSENNPTAESLDSKVQEIKNKYGSGKAYTLNLLNTLTENMAFLYLNNEI